MDKERSPRESALGKNTQSTKAADKPEELATKVSPRRKSQSLKRTSTLNRDLGESELMKGRPKRVKQIGLLREKRATRKRAAIKKLAQKTKTRRLGSSLAKLPRQGQAKKSAKRGWWFQA